MRQFAFSQGAIYIVVQIIGSIFAALLILVIVPYEFSEHNETSIIFPRVPNSLPIFKAFIMTFIGSAFYVWTYYALIVDSRAPSNIFGFGIGAVSAICDLSFTPMIGGVINPIKYIGPRLVTGDLSDSVTYFTAPLLGGIFAGFYFDFFVLKRKEEDEIIDDDDDYVEPVKKPISSNDDFNMNTFKGTRNNSLKNVLFTKNNSDLMEDDEKSEDDDDINESKESSDLDSKNSLYL